MIYNSDCIEGAKKYIPDNSVDLGIFDPPFGIGESSFDKHYKRSEDFVLDGYQESPPDYLKFSVDWLTQAKRVMRPDASMYLFSGWTNLRHVLNAVADVGLYTINHIIWKYNFGVFSKRKYISSHYHVLFLKKDERAAHKFNLNCRFGSQERDGERSLLGMDIEDVFCVNKQYMPGVVKNKNKLPDALVEKLILYSSDEGDTVCDFFLGNFTTAYVARRLARVPVGFEVNPQGFDRFLRHLVSIAPGSGLESLKRVENVVPANQGKPLSDGDRRAIWDDFRSMSGITKKKAIAQLCEKYGRGRFSIINVLERFRGQ